MQADTVVPLSSTDKEFITIEQFAGRLRVSRNTTYNWLAQGKLTAGTHYIRVGRVIRIIWSDDLMTHLLSLSLSKEDSTVNPQLKRTGKGGKNRIAFDHTLFDNV